MAWKSIEYVLFHLVSISKTGHSVSFPFDSHNSLYSLHLSAVDFKECIIFLTWYHLMIMWENKNFNWNIISIQIIQYLTN